MYENEGLYAEERDCNVDIRSNSKEEKQCHVGRKCSLQQTKCRFGWIMNGDG
jgi:hypothetical protein